MLKKLLKKVKRGAQKANKGASQFIIQPIIHEVAKDAKQTVKNVQDLDRAAAHKIVRPITNKVLGRTGYGKGGYVNIQDMENKSN